MDIFHINESLKTYTYPIVKLLICITIITLLICRGQITDNKTIEEIIGVCCAIVGIICIYCGYISIFEICQVRENRLAISANSNYSINDSKAYTIDEVVNMVQTNDIIEIQIIANNKIVVMLIDGIKQK